MLKYIKVLQRYLGCCGRLMQYGSISGRGPAEDEFFGEFIEDIDLEILKVPKELIDFVYGGGEGAGAAPTLPHGAGLGLAPRPQSGGF